MTTEELIDPSIEILTPTQTVEDVVDIMQNSEHHILPVVFENKFIGFVKEDQLLNILDSEKEIGYFPIDNKEHFIKNTEHVYNLVHHYIKYNTTILAVLDENNNYIGTVTQDNLRLLFKDWLCFTTEGAIIVLDINILTYSLSEICRIAESNGVKILSAEITEDFNNKNKNYLTLKFNTDELSRVVAAFERYQYTVVSVYHNPQFDNIDQQRLDNLLKFLNI
ncbi:MAG: CBS domain-containing protein [Cytophagales bacterium]